MKNHYHTFVLIVVIVLGLCGTAYAAEGPAFNASPVVTNVWFAKMIKTNDTYTFKLLPTGYTGLSDYGRLTFITGATDIPSGDYALIQLTRNGTKLIRSLKVTRYGNSTTEYMMLRLELNKEDLVEPLYFPDLAIPDQVSTLQTPPLNTTQVSPATTAKAPAGMATILAGLCIAGFIGTLRLRR
jgi:hypothetical protein